MPTQPITETRHTLRDREILAALEYAPLTVEQLLKLSRTFAIPFTDARRVRERMHQLVEARRVQRFAYATAGTGAPSYYTLSLLGYRLLYGPQSMPPSRRAFEPVGIARQRHAHALADFIVHLLVAAYAGGIEVRHFARENTLRLTVREEILFPDCAFQLRTPEGRTFNYLVELDNRTERIRSDKDADSLQRKIRLYEAFAAQASNRFRVLMVTTQSTERVRHILDVARELAGEPQRRLVYGIALADFLRCAGPLHEPIFREHHGQRVPLLSAGRTPETLTSQPT